jgi:hypothetical protein
MKKKDAIEDVQDDNTSVDSITVEPEEVSQL